MPHAEQGAALLIGRDERITLASRSPRRAQLLAMLGVSFDVIAGADENGRRRSEESPADYVIRLAREKALAVARQVPCGIVLGADTIVHLDGQILEKPRDAQEAADFLRRLSGREHEVYTGICLAPAGGGAPRCAVERSAVRFVDLDEATIHRYVATGEPLDKAGAYGIQGFGGMLVAEIRGCYFNVMGLPLARLRALFAELGAPTSG
ncbi:MAG: Maf family protein [Candidatus Eisenbacteria bacterium]